MLSLEAGIFLVVCAIGVVAYLFGKAVGRERGYDEGFMAGHRHGTKKWQEAMEKRRGPDGLDSLVRILPRTREDLQS